MEGNVTMQGPHTPKLCALPEMPNDKVNCHTLMPAALSATETGKLGFFAASYRTTVPWNGTGDRAAHGCGAAGCTMVANCAAPSVWAVSVHI